MIDRSALIIPDATVFDEKTIVTTTDVVVGDRATLAYGLCTKRRVFVGEHVFVGGGIECGDDVLVDRWSQVHGDVVGKRDIYLGDKVKVEGKVSVGRDFDLGSGVLIEKGFEAKGWINIRAPLPLLIYIFIYLLELLRLGHSKEVEKILQELENLDSEGTELFVYPPFLLVPEGAVVSQDEVLVKGDCRIGSDCKIVGNYRVEGTVEIGMNTEFFGSIHAEKNVSIGQGTVVQGDIVCKDALLVCENAQVLGDIKSGTVSLRAGASVMGVIRAEDGVRLAAGDEKLLREKLERFRKGIDYEELLSVSAK